jgi:hypothetical protein
MLLVSMECSLPMMADAAAQARAPGFLGATTQVGDEASAVRKCISPCGKMVCCTAAKIHHMGKSVSSMRNRRPSR